MVTKQLIPDRIWDRYKTVISGFIDNDTGKQAIVWKRAINQPRAYGEDSKEKFFPDISLEVLVGYNYMRQWPINKSTTTGENDDQNCVIWVSKNKLSTLGYLDSNGYWVMDQSLDRFLISGKIYKMAGDTQVSQAKDSPLLFMVILKREEPEEL